MQTFPWFIDYRSGEVEVTGFNGRKKMVLPTLIGNGQLATDMAKFADDYPAAPLIQDAFPTMTADEREFLMSGVTPDEWDALFPEEEED